MTIETQGFLSPDIGRTVSKVRGDCAEWFEFAASLNEVGHKILYGLKVSEADQPKFLISLLAARLLSNFQGCVLMAERAMDVESRILARAALETTFVIRAVLNDEKIVDKIVDAEHRSRKTLRNALRTIPELGEAQRRAIDFLDAEPEGARLPVKQVAIAADLESIYETLYRSLSGDSHTSLGALERYVAVGKDKEITGLEYGPGNFDLPASMVPATFAMLVGLDGVAAAHAHSEHDADLQALKGKYYELVPPKEANIS
jgi:hypothetical protein